MTLLAFLRTSPLWTLLGWTVLLSLTLGGAAAAAALLLRRLAPRLTARQRYQLVALLYMVSALVALPIAVAPRAGSIEVAPVPSTSYAVRAPARTLLPDASGPVVVSMHVTTSQPGAGAVVVPVLAVVWFGATAVAALRLLTGLWMIRRIARRASRVEDPTLDTLLDHVKQRMNVGARITLRESADVDTAVTGGWWRPFVLLPTGMTKALAAADLELVLAHELAHVRRRDFPVAIVQAVGDIATTLSPGHRWLSSEASRLREEACDDAVVATGVEPTQYARVLEGLARWSRGLRVSRTVCAANRHLVERVRRLVGDPAGLRPGLPALVGLTATLCLAVAATALVAKASPGLPVPPTGAHLRSVGPRLIAWQDVGGDDTATPQQTP